MVSETDIFWLLLVLAAAALAWICTFRDRAPVAEQQHAAASATPFPIDLVYTWAGDADTGNMRTANNNELQHSLRSTEKFMPWINHVYVLMNPPAVQPPWLKKGQTRVTFVGHEATFPRKEDMPSTNSNAIEWTMMNIPGLSEHFVYFNDDTFAARSVPYTEFFTKDGLPVLQPCVKDAAPMKIKDGAAPPFALPLVIDKFFYPHVPVPLRKSQMRSFASNYSRYVNWVRSVRSRTHLGCSACTQIGIETCPCAQMQGTLLPYLYAHGQATNTGSDEFYVSHDNPQQLDVLEKLTGDELPFTFTINDSAETKDDRDNMKAKVGAFFGRFFPDKASIET